MKAKYHINPETGDVNQCSASIRDCPYAVNEQLPEHYDDKKYALKVSEENLAKKYGLNVLKKKETSDISTAFDAYVKTNYSTEDSDFVNSSVPLSDFKKKKPTLILEKFDTFRKELIKKPMPVNMSAQEIASQIGNTMEHVIERNINQDKSFKGSAVSGGKLESKVKRIQTEFKKSNELNIEEINQICEENHLDKELMKEIIINDKPVQFPDIIVVDTDKENGKTVIRVAEMKTSGQNDSSAVPKNIDKMRFDTENSAIQWWKHNEDVELDRAVLLTATRKNSRGKFTNQSTWENSLKKRGVSDVSVFSNEEGFSWLKNKPSSSDEYLKDIVDMAVLIKVKETMEID